MSFCIKTIIKSILALFVATALLSPSLFAQEPTQEERNEMAAKLIPIITMLLMDGDSTPPLKPSLTTPLPDEVDQEVVPVEVNGEAGAKIFVNGVEAGVIGGNGRATVLLTFVNGVNTMTITLKDKAGNESDGLTFSVSYDAPPVITLSGDEDIYLVKGDTFVDPGATATDANEGSVDVNTTGSVDETSVGDYNLTYTAADSRGGTSTKVRQVHVLPVGSSTAALPMDLTKVDGFNGATDPDKLAGEVQNQYWIEGKELTEAELNAIVSAYPIVTVVGYSDTYGLLVEIPLNNAEAKSAIASIELEEKITDVRHRVYLGSGFYHRNTIALPNDDVSGYYDNGDNWHLENIDILHAWEISTGSSDVAVGVVDAGFYANHEDLTIKTANNYSKGIKDDHGTAVASIIGADTNNGKGITAINWSSPLVVSIFKDYDANISYRPENYFRDIFELSADHAKVKLVNCSFGPPPDENAQKENQDMLKITQKYRDKLFIFSAGNYHNNSKLTFGALHLNKNFENRTKKDNILIVAALLKDGTLPYYSNYGKTVDIAAPTSMKTAKSVKMGGSGGKESLYHSSEKSFYGTDHLDDWEVVDGWWVSKSFNGTSAAAPVVTGVASLIYSLNPDFTPQEVKKILIDSASSKVCLRHMVKRYTDETKNKIKKLPDEDCIPKLNASNALALAKQIVDAKKALLLHYYPSVFSRVIHLYVDPPSQLSIESLVLYVQGKKRADGNWEDITVTPSDSTLTQLSDNTNELAFFTDRKYSEYNITGTLKYAGYAPIDVELTLNHTLVEDYTEFKDKISQEYLNGVEVMIEYLDGFTTGNTLGLGKVVDKNVTLYFEQGREYKETVKKENYKTFSSIELYKSDSELFGSNVLELVSQTAEPAGNLIVYVNDENGTAITNATVTLASSNAIINQIPPTGKSGLARILDIPILDDNDEFIAYTLEVVRRGYIGKTVENIGLVDGKSPLLRITLQKDPNYTNIPPVARAGADQNITLGQSVTLSASASSDVETPNAYLTYKWSGPTIETSYDVNVTLTNLALGVHHIVLQVTDEEGAISTDIVTVTVTESGSATSTLKKTGQTKSYDENGNEVTDGSIKDDGYYQTGVTPSYTRDDTKEIVTDHITGLEWQDNEEAETVTKPWLTQENYDKCTGSNGQTQDTSKCYDTSGDTAASYCTNLSLDGEGWRLPTVVELQSIVVDGAFNPSIDTTAFANYNTSNHYWSSTTHAYLTDRAWIVTFYDGYTSYGDKPNATYYVRCVRGN
jgi:hypothetical protein